MWPGGAGPWFAGVVVNGIAYTDVYADIPAGALKSTDSLQQEFRAYDAQGRVVPVKG